MYSELLEQMQSLVDKGEVFSLAQVVWREAPCSGKPGDKAIIKKDGSVIGWIGGGCVKGIMLKEGLEAIKDQKYRLVKITPGGLDSPLEDEFIKQYKMTCHSGGSMEIFIEPVVPNPHLIIFGRSYIARALARIGKAANFKVSVFGSEVSEELFPTADAIHDTFEMDSVPITKNSFIVVSTQGENDEIAVKNALLSKCNYVGFVASKKKCQEVMTYLIQDQVDKSLVDTLVTPVGLDIKAKTPDEVAISILAQIVKQFRESSEVSDIQEEEVFGTKEKDEEPDVIVNPVCNLPISRASSKYTIREGGHLLYFCCDGCKVSFDKNKEMYLQKMEK